MLCQFKYGLIESMNATEIALSAQVSDMMTKGEKSEEQVGQELDSLPAADALKGTLLIYSYASLAGTVGVATGSESA